MEPIPIHGRPDNEQTRAEDAAAELELAAELAHDAFLSAGLASLPEEPYQYEPPKPEELTCFKCPARQTCEYVDDDYNTGGDCLAMK